MHIVSRTNPFVRITVILTLSLGLSAQAHEIVVEAPRLDENRLDPSRSVMVITQDDIERKRPLSVADLLRELPGVQLTRQGGGHGQTSTLSLRGARTEGTLVLIDGAEVNDASSPGSGFDFSFLSPNHIARIEIYRGPQSVRFGAGALGGVINIVTKEGLGQKQTSYTIEGGSLHTGKASVVTSIGSESFGFSGGVDTLNTKGMSAAAGGQEKDGAQIHTASGKFNWQPSSTSSLAVNFRASKARVDIDQFGGAAGDDPNQISKGTYLTGGIVGASRFLNERLKTSLGFWISDTEREVDNPADDIHPTSSNDKYRGQNRKAQFDADYIFSETHTLRFGLQWREERADSHSQFGGVASEWDGRTQSVSGAALTLLSESETWFYDAGFRYDSSTTLNSIPSTRASLGRNFQQADAKASLTYGTGFKLPSLYQLHSAFGNVDLRTEKAETIDFSLEKKISSRVFTNVTFFESRHHDLIDFEMATSRYFNIRRAKSRGLEAHGLWSFLPQSRLELNYSFLETWDMDTRERLVRRPKHSGSLSIHNDIGQTSNFLRFRYRGERADVDPVSFGRMESPSHYVLDLGTSYQFSNSFQVYGRVENLFDKKYEEIAGYSSPGLLVFLGISGEI